jgi:uncharacterized protein YecT (DUF1311 family)
MLRFIRLFIVALTVLASSAARALGSECDAPKEGSTLQESCLLQSGFDAADSELNRTYRKLLQQWKPAQFKEERLALVAAQRAWLSYRDKTCSFEQVVHGGSESISHSRCVVRLTSDRTEYLKELLNTE